MFNPIRIVPLKPLVLLLVGAALLVCPQDADAIWGKKKKKKKKIADQLTQIDTNKNPLARFWSDPKFVNLFMETYGAHPKTEPEFNTEEERLLFNEKIRPLLRENPEEAEKELVKIVDGDSNPLFDFYLGTIYFQKGGESNDVARAMKSYQSAVAKFDPFQRAHKNLGLSLARAERYNEAIPHLTRTIALGGADAAIYGLLGFCYLNKGHYISAEAAYKNAMLLNPEEAKWKLGVVRSMISSENYKPALKLLDELLSEAPDQESLWTLQAGVYMQMGEVAKAAVSLEVLRKLGKIDSRNLSLLGDIYMSQDAHALALPVYMQVIEKDGPQDLSRSLRAADILSKRGANEETMALLKRIREVAGSELADADDMKLLKLETKMAMAEGRGEEAITVLEEIISKNPMDGEALLMAGDYYSRNGRREEAENRYNLAAKIEEYEVQAYRQHAQALVRVQEYQDAVELLRKAQRIQPMDNVQRFLEKVEMAATRSASSKK